MNKRTLSVTVLCLLLIAAACAPNTSAPAPAVGTNLQLSSTAFKDGETIPVKYTCSGAGMSPPLAWARGPEGTKSFALIVDDPDAPRGVFTHWVIFNIPSSTTVLAEGVSPQAQLPGGTLQGENGTGKAGYQGPCPPAGNPHHYRFTIYAVDKVLDLKAGATKQQVIDAMQGHVLAQATLTGLYGR